MEGNTVLLHCYFFLYPFTIFLSNFSLSLASGGKNISPKKSKVGSFNLIVKAVFFVLLFLIKFLIIPKVEKNVSAITYQKNDS